MRKKLSKISVNSVKIIKTLIEDKKFLGEDVKAIKVYANAQSELSKIIEKLPKDIEIREHDINPVTRYILQKKINPLNWYKASGEILNESGEFSGIDKSFDVDYVIKAEKIWEEKLPQSDQIFAPKVIAFDIETDEFEIGKGEIIMVSLYGKDLKKVLTLKNVNAPNYVVKLKDERELLLEFAKIIKKENPDIITGYFSDGFDLPYIKSRAEKLKVKMPLGLDGGGVKLTGGNNPRAKVSGRVHIDLLKFIQTAYSQYLQSETLSLGDVANELLGEKKKEHEFKHSSKLSGDEWVKFFEYNLHDSYLTYELFLKAWPDMSEFTKITKEPLWNVTRDGMSSNVENYIIHNLYKYNEIIERKPTHDEISKRRSREKYEGAFVLEPKPKLYEDIVMFDFTSYWPSIIATFNLSKSTMLEKKEKNSLEIDIGKGKKAYFNKKKGFFPEILEEIIKLRKQYKEEYKKNPDNLLKARSNAFKLLANASYGYQGFFGARYYCPEASAAATSISRDYLKKVIKEAESSDFKVIYSDTDSIALELNGKTQKQTLEFLKKINDKLPGIMELELEDFYKRGIWVTTRKGEIGAKKKYALINEKGNLKIRGFETVRRDWCKLARELQNKVLEKILKEGNEKSALIYTKEVINKKNISKAVK